MKTAKELRVASARGAADQVELLLKQIAWKAEEVAQYGGTHLLTREIHGAVKDDVSKRLIALGFKVSPNFCGLRVSWDHET